MTIIESAKALAADLAALFVPLKFSDASKAQLVAVIHKHLTTFSEQWEKRVAEAHTDGIGAVIESVRNLDVIAEKLRTERDQLAEDKKRLDWLADHGDLQHLYEEGRPEETIAVLRINNMHFDFDDVTLRQAIDKASLRAELAKGTQ